MKTLTLHLKEMKIDPMECTTCKNRRAPKCKSQNGKHSDLENPYPIGNSYQLGQVIPDAPWTKQPPVVFVYGRLTSKGLVPTIDANGYQRFVDPKTTPMEYRGNIKEEDLFKLVDLAMLARGE